MMNIFMKRITRNHPDENKIRIWENERFNTFKLYEDLLTTFEEEYPDYYRLKYDASILSLRSNTAIN